MSSRHFRSFLALPLALGLLAACQSEKEKQAELAVEAAASANRTAEDTKLAKALASVTGSATAIPSAAPASGGADVPDDGIYDVARADREAPEGAPPKLEVGDTGAGAKAKLSVVSFEAGKTVKVPVAFHIVQGRGMTPTVVMELELTRKKGDGDEESDGKDAAPRTFTLKGEVAKVAAGSQLASIPAQMQAALAKLKGSSFELEVFAGGGVKASTVKAAKGADPGVAPMVETAVQILSGVLVAAPSEPVGKGATWITTSREEHQQIPVVAHRMVKVAEVQGSKFILEVNTKRFAVGAKHQLADVGEITLQNYVGQGQMKLEVDTTSAGTIKGQYLEASQAMLDEKRGMIGQIMAGVGGVPAPMPQQQPGAGGPGGGAVPPGAGRMPPGARRMPPGARRMPPGARRLPPPPRQP